MYVKDSLCNTDSGFELVLQNLLAATTITGAGPLTVDGRKFENKQVILQFERSAARPGREREPLVRTAESIETAKAVRFDLHITLRVMVHGVWLAPGEHRCTLTLKTREVGDLVFELTDQVGERRNLTSSGFAANGRMR
jgi:hypothetical protein